MKRVFVDSGGFFALQVTQDASHALAGEVFRQAEGEGWRLVTTNVVVIETYALLLSRTRAGRSAAIAFLDALDRSSMQIESKAPQDLDQARTETRDEGRRKRGFSKEAPHADSCFTKADTVSIHWRSSAAVGGIS